MRHEDDETSGDNIACFYLSIKNSFAKYFFSSAHYLYFTFFFYGSETSSRQADWRVQVMIDNPIGTNAHLFLPKSKTKIFPWWSPAANASPVVLKAVRRNLMFLPCNEKALDAEWLMDTIKLLEMKNYFEGKLIGQVRNS